MQNTIEKIETFLPELERMCKAIQAARTRLIGAITIRDGAPGQPHLVTAAQLKEEMEGELKEAIAYRRAYSTLRERLYNMPCKDVLELAVMMLVGIAMKAHKAEGNENPFDNEDYYARCKNINCVHGHVKMEKCVNLLMDKYPATVSHIRYGLGAFRSAEEAEEI